MFYKHNVTIVDESLAAAEDDGLQHFAKRIWQKNAIWNNRGEPGSSSEVGGRNGSRVGCDHSGDTEAQPDQDERSAEPDQCLQNDIHRKPPEAVSALQVTALASERDVECSSNGEQDNENRTWQVEEVRDCFLKEQQEQRDDDAAYPRTSVEASMDRKFPLWGTLLRNRLGGNNLERKGNC